MVALSVTAIPSAPVAAQRAAEYFCAPAAAGIGNYYAGPCQRWLVSPAYAAALGVNSTALTGEELHRLIAGIDPAGRKLNPHAYDGGTGRSPSGKPKGRRRDQSSQKGQPIGAHDITLSAPKSLSVLWALGAESAAAAATRIHDAGVAGAIDFLRSTLSVSRRGKGGTRLVPAEFGILAVQHFDARPTADPITGEPIVADPQMHTHLVLPNLTVARDGSVRALNSNPLDRLDEIRTAYLLGAAKAARLEGVKIEKAPHGFEISGIGDELQRLFSKRTGQMDPLIERWAIERGVPVEGLTADESADLSRLAALATRSGKESTASIFTLRGAWREQVAAAGLALPEAEAREQVEPEERWAQICAAADEAVGELISQRAVLTTDLLEHALIRATICWGLEMSELGELVDRCVAKHFICRVAEAPVRADRGQALAPGSQFLVSRHVAEAEAAVRSITASLAVRKSHHVLREELEVAAAAWAVKQPQARGTGRFLRWVQKVCQSVWSGRDLNELTVETYLQQAHRQSDEQSRAVLGAAHQDLTVIEGAAGAGKTTALNPIVAAYLNCGRTVFGLATAWRTARALTETGIHADHCVAVALFLSQARERMERAVAGGHDPATGLQGWLSPGALLVVDEASMLAMADMAELLRIAELAGAKILLVGDRAQLGAVAPGSAMAVMADVLDELNGPSAHHQKHRAYQSILTGRRQLTDLGKKIAMAFRLPGAGQRSQAAEALAALTDAGDLQLTQGPAESLAAAVTTWASAHAAGRSVLIMAISNAEAHQVSLAIRNHRIAKQEIDPAGSIAILGCNASGDDPRPLSLAPGDDVRLFCKVRGTDLVNGSICRIKSIDPNGTLTLQPINAHLEPNGDACTVPLKALAVSGNPPRYKIGYGSAMTVHTAQGATVDEAIFVSLNGRPPDAKATYVAATRHRHRFTAIFDKNVIAAAINKSRGTRGQLINATEIQAWLAKRLSWAPEPISIKAVFTASRPANKPVQKQSANQNHPQVPYSPPSALASTPPAARDLFDGLDRLLARVTAARPRPDLTSGPLGDESQAMTDNILAKLEKLPPAIIRRARSNRADSAQTMTQVVTQPEEHDRRPAAKQP